MTPSQFKKLDDIGFTWQIRESWEENFKRLVAYKAKHGNCNVPRTCKHDKKLARWVNKQRSRYCKDDGLSFPEERLEKLHSLGFVFRLKATTTWDIMFNRLIKYKEEHGNCIVPQDYKDDPQLGRWVNNRRMDYRRGALSQDSINKLKAIKFYFGDCQDNAWDEKYNRLCKYKEIHGNCLVPWSWKPDVKLSNWVYNQRNNKDKISQERITKLNDIGFVWDITKKKTSKSTANIIAAGSKKNLSKQCDAAIKEENDDENVLQELVVFDEPGEYDVITNGGHVDVESSTCVVDVTSDHSNQLLDDKKKTARTTLSSSCVDDAEVFEGKKYFPVEDIMDESSNKINLLSDEDDLLQPSCFMLPAKIECNFGRSTISYNTLHTSLSSSTTSASTQQQQQQQHLPLFNPYHIAVNSNASNNASLSNNASKTMDIDDKGNNPYDYSQNLMTAALLGGGINCIAPHGA